MKKLILFAITIASLMVSCKKENIKNVTPETGVANETSSTASAARVVPQGNMEDYIIDATDPQNERINKALYGYMLGMRKVFETDPNYLAQALQYAKQSPLQTVGLHEFICQTNTCKTMFNGELCAKYPAKGTGYDHCVKMLEEMDYKYLTYDKEFYEPGMYIVNAAKADLTEGYYLALAEEVYNADVNHDYIPAWHVLKNGITRLELINEQQANQSKEPVIIFSPVSKYFNPGSGPYQPPVTMPPSPLDREPFIPPAPPVGATWSPIDIFHRYVHINERFEEYGASQYKISYVISNEIGAVIEKSDFKDLDNVPENYVACFCYYSIYLKFFRAEKYNTVMTFVTYEHDWWATGNHPKTPGGSYQVLIKSKYSHETYQEVGNMIVGSRNYDAAGENAIISKPSGQIHGIDK